MTCNVIWSVSPVSLFPGNPATLIFEGLPPNIEFRVDITLPSGSHYILPVIGDSKGKGEAQVLLDSGIGNYTFTPSITCCSLSPPIPIVITVECCPPSANIICPIDINGPTKILKNNTQSLLISGLRPAVLTRINYSANGLPPAFDLILSGIDGTISWPVPATTSEIYTITVSDGYCVSAPFIVEVAEADNIPSIIVGGLLSCENSLILTASFDKQDYKIGNAGVLLVSICSRGLAPTDIQINPPLLPTNINFSVPPLLGAVVLPTVNNTVNACVDYAFPFTVVSVGNMVADYTGTYKCEGDTYNINAGSAIATATTGVDVICSAGSFILPSIFPIGIASTGQLELSIINTGTQIISNINLSPVTLPGPLATSEIIKIENLTLLPGVRYTRHFIIRGVGNIEIPGQPSPPNIITSIMIAAEAITGICGGETIPLNTENMFASYTILPRPPVIFNN
jgi:hypothetical protein